MKSARTRIEATYRRGSAFRKAAERDPAAAEASLCETMGRLATFASGDSADYSSLGGADMIIEAVKGLQGEPRDGGAVFLCLGLLLFVLLAGAQARPLVAGKGAVRAARARRRASCLV